MSRIEVRLSGYGGQGIVSAAYILGKAVAIYDRKYASLTPSYGPESRGGACAADLVIDDEPIDNPLVTRADILMALSQPAYTRYAGDLVTGGLLITEADMVSPNGVVTARRYSVPATRLADKLGRKVVANVIALGFLAAHSSIATPAALREAIRTSVPKGTEELNLRAFGIGMSCAARRPVLDVRGLGDPLSGAPRLERGLEPASI
jgi:2-oxoglutarate ferredoxin oxidoreductase subunit gamma